MKSKVLFVAAIAAAGTLGCGSEGAQEQAADRVPLSQEGSRDLLPEVAALLDAGNAHYRANEYQLALDSYQKAVELAPDEASVWMGVRMAALALEDSAVADAALARIQELVPSSEMVHPPQNSMPQDSIHGAVERETSSG
jgi:Flp pilus assembly protein TadD